ncbi:MAG: hypothetical protein LUI05_00725 [Oscillospiraceae bacterium]|nr:hypothetical protein [Oscillospiraceae bacterium]
MAGSAVKVNIEKLENAVLRLRKIGSSIDNTKDELVAIYNSLYSMSIEDDLENLRYRIAKISLISEYIQLIISGLNRILTEYQYSEISAHSIMSSGLLINMPSTVSGRSIPFDATEKISSATAIKNEDWFEKMIYGLESGDNS